jgi:hypothetical protein
MSDPVFFRPPSRVLPLITLGAALVLACVVAGEPPAAGAAGAKPAAKAAAAPRDSMARLKAAVWRALESGRWGRETENS